MIILLLSEARSGSLNLMLWLRYSMPNYIVLTEPYNKKTPDFKTEKKYNTDWIDVDKNYIINEKYYPNCGDLTELMKISDITLTLFREDSKAQIESFVIADVTNCWRDEYDGNNQILKNLDNHYLDKKIYFEQIKKEFKEFVEFHNLKSFSYEDLYYRGQIDEFKKYFDIKIEVPFPFGKKYRINTKKDRLI